MKDQPGFFYSMVIYDYMMIKKDRHPPGWNYTKNFYI